MEENALHEVVIDAWADYADVAMRAEPPSPLDYPYFFRGQPGDWPLLPALARQAITSEKTSRHFILPARNFPNNTYQSGQKLIEN